MKVVPIHQMDSSSVKRRFSRSSGDRFKTSAAPPKAPDSSRISRTSKGKRTRSVKDVSSEEAWVGEEEIVIDSSDDEIQEIPLPKPSKAPKSKSRNVDPNSTSTKTSRSKFREASPNPVSTKTSKAKHRKLNSSPVSIHSTCSQSLSQAKSSSKTSKSVVPSTELGDFKSNYHAGLWNRVSQKNIWCERNIHEGDFEECQVIVYHLVSQGLGRTFRGLKPFVWKVVQEFYCNINLDVKNPEHPNYGQVFVRGHLFKFSPTVINTHLSSHWIDSEEFIPDFSKIIVDITGGDRRKWPRGKDFPASQLTVKYAILHKIAMRNWLPTSHKTGVNKSMAVLLFKIGNSIAFDIGNFFFNQIMKHANGKNERIALPFPCLIYSILSSQQAIIREKEIVYMDKEEIRISYKLLAGKHVNDLEGVPESVTASDNISDYSLLSRSIKVLEDMLKFLNDQQTVIEKKKTVVTRLLDDLYRKRSTMGDQVAPISHNEEESTQEKDASVQEPTPLVGLVSYDDNSV